MTKEEFTTWYIDNKRWMENKAMYLISTTRADYSQSKELVSLTVESLLSRVEEIKSESINSYFFFWMRNLLYNNILYPYKNTCCEGDFNEYNVKQEDYNIEEDDRKEKQLLILQDRAKTENDKLVLNALIKGKKLITLPLKGRLLNNSVRNIKGLEPLKRSRRKDKPTGNPKGRPKKI